MVHGRVQGVFFRDSCRQQAATAGVTGWVSNEPDGTVHALFEGDPDAVTSLVAWVHDGPPYARVERVDVREVAPLGLPSFEVR